MKLPVTARRIDNLRTCGSWSRSCLVWLVLASAAPLASASPPDPPTWMLRWGSLGSAPAQFNFPVGVATDELGDVFVVDQNNHRVQKFDRVGNFITQWGSYGSASGQFYYPTGIAVDLSGNVYVEDGSNYRIQKFTSAGAYLSQWGSSGTGPGQFTGLGGSLATDAAGNVYVADAHRVQKFTSSGTFVTQWGTLGSGDGQFNAPNSVAVSGAGDVYVVDRLNSRIQKFTSTGVFVARWPLGGNTSDVAVDALGHVYTIDDNGHVTRFSAGGTLEAQWGASGTGDGQFTGPKSLDLDPEGNVYVADTWNNRVQKYSGWGATLSEPPAKYLLSWGSLGSGNGQFNSPMDVTTNAAGEVLVSDFSNSRVQRFTAAGDYLGQWGAFGAGNGEFIGVGGIAVDAAGFVYVVDWNHRRIEKFTGSGAYVSQWGSEGTGNGQFSSPWGLAIDTAGNVCVTDRLLNRIQKFTPAGAYVTQWGSTGTGNGQFAQLYGIAIDRSGHIFVTDANPPHRVQEFSETGDYIGQWGASGSGNGQFSQPLGIAVDPSGNVLIVDSLNGRIQKFTAAGAYLTQWGSWGSGAGQFSGPAGITCDAAGNVYVPDQHRIQKFVSPPAIAMVSDVRGDQGRQVRLRILRCSADCQGAGVTVTGYAVYRRIDPPPAAMAMEYGVESPREPATPGSAALAGWDYVSTIPANGDGEYNVVVPTLADANSTTRTYNSFFVRAMTTSPWTYYDSGVEAGYSIDNLSPPAPTPFTAAYAAGATHLHWGVSGVSDFGTFHLYRGSTVGFTTGPENLVAATTDTGYVDVGGAGSFYKLAAVDLNGNEGPYAITGPAQTTGVEGEAPLALALEGVHPNPANGRALMVSFTLPGEAPARLELLDVAGRTVASRTVGSLRAGRHAVNLAEGRTVAPGFYWVRLSQGPIQRTARVAVVE